MHSSAASGHRENQPTNPIRQLPYQTGTAFPSKLSLVHLYTFYNKLSDSDGPKESSEECKNLFLFLTVFGCLITKLDALTAVRPMKAGHHWHWAGHSKYQPASEALLAHSEMGKGKTLQNYHSQGLTKKKVTTNYLK